MGNTYGVQSVIIGGMVRMSNVSKVKAGLSVLIAGLSVLLTLVELRERVTAYKTLSNAEKGEQD